jgi:Imm-5 like putative immunity protein
MILPKVRDPRFVTIRRGGTLTDSDHRLLALWAAACAEHVVELFESARPEDPRPREAIEHARAWVRGEVKMTEGEAIRELVLDDQRLRNDICWSVFDC